MGYIDVVFFVSKEDQLIRVVRFKIMYIDYNILLVMDVEDLIMNGRVVFDVEQNENIVRESIDMV